MRLQGRNAGTESNGLLNLQIGERHAGRPDGCLVSKAGCLCYVRQAGELVHQWELSTLLLLIVKDPGKKSLGFVCGVFIASGTNPGAS